MADSKSSAPGLLIEIAPHLADLCRNHEVGLELLDRSGDPDTFLDRVLEEYERRLADLAPDALDGRTGPTSAESEGKLRALVMFASLAAAIRERALASQVLAERATSLEELNTELSAALGEAQRARASLDGVLEALDAGILILDASGRILKANPAAGALCGTEAAALLGRELPARLAAVSPRSREVVTVAGPRGESRILLVARRGVPSRGGDEVLLLSDVTEKYREIEERHQLARLGELLRTVGALSHKINNPLTALLGRAQILRARQDGDPVVTKAAKVIEEAALRIADLIRELGAVVKEGGQEALDKVLSMEEVQAPGKEDLS